VDILLESAGSVVAMAVDASLFSERCGVAIVGMSGRFPGAGCVEDFWSNLRDGVESISVLSDAELEVAGVTAKRRFDPRYVRAAAVLEGVELFDAGFFSMSARDAQITDPQHRLFLECAWHALEDAGCDPHRFQGEIGVFAGAARNSYFVRNVSRDQMVREALDDYQIMIGSENDYLATRVAFKLDLRGPAITVQTACSTSLVAVHVACQSLLNGECDVALAGGVSVRVPQKAGYLHKESGMHSPDGHTRPFDSHAGGTVFGSGVGVVVLKPLRGALADGDSIHAVIRGSAVNNDGASKSGFTAPSVSRQAAVIRKALAAAGIDANAIDYIEAHGTGTQKGDPVEIAAISLAFGTGRAPDEPCPIGSVKGNIGHADAASGVAGLIKTVLALEHEALPPTVNFLEPNPACTLTVGGPFFVNDKLRPWRRGSRRRRAGVTSLGFGGTNAHVIVEEAPSRSKENSYRAWHLLVISAKTESALETSTRNLARFLRDNPDIDLASVAFTLQTGRAEFAWRRIVLCQSTADAAGAMESDDSSRVASGLFEEPAPTVTFLFPGHGSHEVNMTRGLYETEPVVRRSIDECSELFRASFDVDLPGIIFPTAERQEEARVCLHRAFYIQSALFMTSYALAMLWKSWGVQPESVLGYSIGEIVAGAVAGVISLPDAVRITGERSRMMQQLPPGAMLAVALSEDDVRPLMGEGLDIGAINGPNHTTVAGPHEAMEDFKRKLDGQRIAYKTIVVPHGYHSRMMEPIFEPYRRVAASISFHAPETNFVSTLLGARATAQDLTDPVYWAREARETIRFSPALETLAATERRIFLEVGPGQLLSKLVRSHPAVSKKHLILSSCQSSKQTISEGGFALWTLGRIWLAGHSVNWAGVYAEERPGRVALPGYPFERQRYWIEPPGEKKSSTQKRLVLKDWTAAAPERGKPVISRSTPARQILAPRNPFENQVAALWQQVLGTADFDIRENFLELGGNSLMAVQLISRVRDVFDVELPVGEFLRTPTVIAMAESIALLQVQGNNSLRVEDLLSEIEALRVDEAAALLTKETRCSENAASPATAGEISPVELSLFFFSGDESAFPHDKYRLVIDATKFADSHGFAAVWTPERHFHRFGGLYPNPAVLGAALAAVTKRINIRAGSVIAPLRDPIRIAEEWALLDNLSHGRVAVAFATGFHPVDFMLSPDKFGERSKLTIGVVEAVRRYWRGEPVYGKTGTGEEAQRVLFPRPVQPELPVWLTATRSTETFIQAGRIGANVLTAVLRINVEEMAEKIAAYRQARSEHGHDPATGKVTLMLHAFVGSSTREVREIVSGPFREYLRSHLEFLLSTGTPLSCSEEENLLSLAFDRFYEHGSLFGTPDSCLHIVERFAAIGVDEIACLIDFGIDYDTTMAGLHHLANLTDLLKAVGGLRSHPVSSLA
jgi:natural product biosynthesis luciferase-like monooxygenase protein